MKGPNRPAIGGSCGYTAGRAGFLVRCPCVSIVGGREDAQGGILCSYDRPRSSPVLLALPLGPSIGIFLLYGVMRAIEPNGRVVVDRDPCFRGDWQNAAIIGALPATTASRCLTAGNPGRHVYSQGCPRNPGSDRRAAPHVCSRSSHLEEFGSRYPSARAYANAMPATASQIDATIARHARRHAGQLF